MKSSITMICISILLLMRVAHGVTCSQNLDSKLQCTCLLGCIRCHMAYQNYNLRSCINECMETRRDIIDDSPHGCSPRRFPKRR